MIVKLMRVLAVLIVFALVATACSSNDEAAAPLSRDLLLGHGTWSRSTTSELLSAQTGEVFR